MLMTPSPTGSNSHPAASDASTGGAFGSAHTDDPAAAAIAYQRGVSAHGRGEHHQALEAFFQAAALDPQVVAHHYAAASLLRMAGRGREAAERFRRALALDPVDPGATNGLGHCLATLGDDSGAIAHYRRGMVIQPVDGGARNHLVGSLQRTNRVGEAVEVLRAALAAGYAGIDDCCNLAILLNQSGRWEEAVAVLRRAISRHPTSPRIMHRLASLHLARFQSRLGEVWARLAAELEPENAGTWDVLGRSFEQRGRHVEAADCFSRAIALQPNLAHCHFNLGMMLEHQGRNTEVVEPYDRAIRLDPDLVIGYEKLSFKFAQCIWRDYDADVDRCLDVVRRRGDRVLPLPFMYIPTLPADQYLCAKRMLEDSLRPFAESIKGSAFPHARADKERLTIGYVSGDFREHAVAFLIAEVFELHDRDRFRVLGYCSGPERGDQPMRRRLGAAFDRLTLIRDMDTRAAAELIHRDGVDILVDLSGHTRYSRHDVFAVRPAPIQATYLGFPGTVGADFIDYVLTDTTVTPLDEQPHFAERLARLPHCYQANDRKRVQAARIPTRAEAGLPENGFVFCCFNNTAKLSPHVFDVWMRLLREVPGSVLWLLLPEAPIAENLRREAAARGVDPARLVFAPRTDPPNHLARMALADLFVDTFYYNAHTTGSDAMWVGLPMVSLLGDSFPARVGASLLRASGLPELVAHTPAEYESLALALARDPERLAALRARLVAGRDTCPLFDTPRFVRHVERAYETMWGIWMAGEAPRPFTVEAE